MNQPHATSDHLAGEEIKHETRHVEKLENGSDNGINAEYQTYDPKWEAKTVRKIDMRLLIIRECALGRARLV